MQNVGFFMNYSHLTMNKAGENQIMNPHPILCVFHGLKPKRAGHQAARFDLITQKKT